VERLGIYGGSDFGIATASYFVVHTLCDAHADQSMHQDIAVTIRPSKDAVENADFIAQADQQGSGIFRQKHRMSTNLAPADESQSAGDQQLQQLEMVKQQRELKFEEKVLMTVLSWQKQRKINAVKKPWMNCCKANIRRKQRWWRVLKLSIYSANKILVASKKLKR